MSAATAAGVSLALAAPTPGDETSTGDRFALTCAGAMSAGGRADADPIVASATVDLANRSVSGFGLGHSPIVVVNDAVIAFGSAAADTLTRVAEPRAAKVRPATGTTVEGTIDRTNGATRIVVHPAADPAGVLIAMTLDCAIEPALR